MSDRAEKAKQLQEEIRKGVEDLAQTLARVDQARRDFAPISELVDEACKETGLDRREVMVNALRFWREANGIVADGWRLVARRGAASLALGDELPAARVSRETQSQEDSNGGA
jgi:phage baseplate assembly protein W